MGAGGAGLLRHTAAYLSVSRSGQPKQPLG